MNQDTEKALEEALVVYDGEQMKGAGEIVEYIREVIKAEEEKRDQDTEGPEPRDDSATGVIMLFLADFDLLT